MRVYNFSPGPATLPEPVLRKIQEDITSYKNGKFWIGEVSHRSPIFTDLLAECRQKLQRVLEIEKIMRINFSIKQKNLVCIPSRIFCIRINAQIEQYFYLFFCF